MRDEEATGNGPALTPTRSVSEGDPTPTRSTSAGDPALARRVSEQPSGRRKTLFLWSFIPHPSSLILFFVLFGYRLADRDLWSSHEGRAAQDAQTILLEKSWGLPHLFDRRLELQKPPLYYWLVAAVAWVRGGPVDAWAVRLPAAAAGLGGVLVMYLLGVWRRRPVAGLTAALILGTAVHYTDLARTGRIDMPLALAVSLALGCFYLGRCRRRENGANSDQTTQARSASEGPAPRWRFGLISSNDSRVVPGSAQGAWGWYLPAYVALAAAVLLKGPVGAVLPAAVASVYLLTEGALPAPWQIRRLWGLAHELGLWWGLPLVLALAAPWFVWAGLQTDGSLFRTFFWHHNFDRAFGGSGGLRAHPWYLYGPYLAGNLLPWSPLLPPALWYLGRRGWLRSDPEARFGLVWLVTIFVVLSLARFKRADYLLPAYPGAALLLGCAGERWYRTSRHPRRLAAAFAVALLGCGAGWWGYLNYVLPAREPALEYRRFAAEIRRRVPVPELVLFFRAEAHALAFHIGPPIDTFLEWENLDVWAGRPGCYYIVMPEECAREWPRHVSAGRLEEVLRSTDLEGARHRQRPLVLLRTHPNTPTPP